MTHYDKKNINDEPMFVLLNSIGDVEINQTVTKKEIREAFKFYQT